MHDSSFQNEEHHMPHRFQHHNFNTIQQVSLNIYELFGYVSPNLAPLLIRIQSLTIYPERAINQAKIRHKLSHAKSK
jgi:hypothetical protein